jgi:integrase
MAKAWVYQDDKQVKKHGEEKASWYVGWIDPAGKRRCKSCTAGPEGKRNAEKLRKRLEAELTTGTYEDTSRSTWAEFRAQYEEDVLDGMKAENRRQTVNALDHFGRILNVKKIASVSSADVVKYVAARRKERGVRKGSLTSPATINKEMRHLRAVFRKAKKMDYLTSAPDVDFLRVPKKIPTWIPPEDLAKLYLACDAATLPRGVPYPPADWWRALLVFGYMTGWRIGSMLALERAEVDLDAGTAFSPADDNKGDRDQVISLPPLVLEHLKRIKSFGPLFFPWSHTERALYRQFAALQAEAAVRPARGKARYGFHDLRRAFATLNAGRLSADVLQALMQHKSYTTTQGYIDLARQMRPASHDVFVPDLGVPPKAAGG